MNELRIFEHEDFGNIRAVEIDGEPWFMGKDVAAALEYSNPRDALSKHVDDEDKNTVAFHDGSQGIPISPLSTSPAYTASFFPASSPV